MELADLAEGYPHPQKLGVEVWSVSMGTAYAHLARQQREKLLPNVRSPMAPDLTPSLSRFLRVYDPEIGPTPRGTFYLPSHRSPSSDPKSAISVEADTTNLPHKASSPPPAQKNHTSPHRERGSGIPPFPQKERSHAPPLSSGRQTALISIAQLKIPRLIRDPKRTPPLTKLFPS
jgi:hypothetical protein